MNAIGENKEIKEIDSLVTKLCKSLGIDLTADQIGDSTKAHSRPRKKSR